MDRRIVYHTRFCAGQINEIGRIGRVYCNAAITFAASHAKAVWDGFLGERPHLGSELPDMVFELPCQRSDGLSGRVVIVPLTFENTEPLDSRGWTFQERVLSNRVLDFEALRTQWTCRTNSRPLLSDSWSARLVDRAYGSFGLETGDLGFDS